MSQLFICFRFYIPICNSTNRCAVIMRIASASRHNTIISLPSMDNVMVITPFINISTHIIQSEFIGLFLTYCMYYTITVVFTPTNFINNIASCILETFRYSSSSCRLFPFCFSRQPKSDTAKFTSINHN
jgi:hypothetical protein